MRSGVIKRFGSYFIDNILLSILSIPFMIPVFTSTFRLSNTIIDLENNMITESEFFEMYFEYLGFIMIFSLIVGLIATVLYNVLIPFYWDGKTVGRHICGIKIKTINGNKLSFGKLFVREVIFKQIWWSATMGIGAFIDFIMIAVRDDKQSIRDIVTNTQVVEEDGEKVRIEHQNF
ncbi:RDD family protein [Mycoplasmatota bacterium WC44]